MEELSSVQAIAVALTIPFIAAQEMQEGEEGVHVFAPNEALVVSPKDWAAQVKEATRKTDASLLVVRVRGLGNYEAEVEAYVASGGEIGIIFRGVVRALYIRGEVEA